MFNEYESTSQNGSSFKSRRGTKSQSDKDSDKGKKDYDKDFKAG